MTALQYALEQYRLPYKISQSAVGRGRAGRPAGKYRIVTAGLMENVVTALQL